MALYQATPGVADPVKFNSSLSAVDLAGVRAFGLGILSGLTVDASATVQPGEAMVGHVIALAAAFALNPSAGPSLLAASAVNSVFLQLPPFPACVGTDGRDVGVVVVNQTGTAPAGAVLLATVTTGAITSPSVVPVITAVSNSPAGRRSLGAPMQGEVLLTLTGQPLTLTPGLNYVAGVTFASAGTFPGARYRAGCTCSDPNLIINESLGQKSSGKMFFTFHYANVGSSTPVTVTVFASADGIGYTGQQTTGVSGTWDTLTQVN